MIISTIKRNNNKKKNNTKKSINPLTEVKTKMLGNICMVFPEHLKHEVIMDQNVLV
jgi:hypothetical protein